MRKRKSFMRRSQMGLEFVLLFSLAAFVMSILLVSFYEMNRVKSDEKIDMKMADFAYAVQSELITASEMNDGYIRTFQIPHNVENVDYNISIQQTNLVIQYGDLVKYYRIPSTNGTLRKGMNTIKKIDNVIEINP